MFDIVYEDKRLLAINKPAGIASSGRVPDDESAAEGMLRQKHRAIFAVHQLDKGTSGVLLFAKKRSALREMHELFRERKVQKTYRLWVSGIFEKDIVTCRAPLYYDKEQRRTIVEQDVGKKSCTRFERVRIFKEHRCTELLAHPTTGRTHQIRVHAQSLGHAVIGDERYGDKASALRLALHAETLRSDLFEISAPAPEFASLIRG